MPSNTSVRHTSYADQYKIITTLTAVGLYGRVTLFENGLLVDRDVAAQELSRVHTIEVSPQRVRTTTENFKYLSWPYPETSEEAAKETLAEGLLRWSPPDRTAPIGGPGPTPGTTLGEEA